jgi:hypothetical protein
VLRAFGFAVALVVPIVATAEVPHIGDGPLTFASPSMRVWSSLPAPAAADRAERAPVARVRTVPTFEDTFTFGGQTFTYDMVGTNPRLTSGRTVVPTVIVPLRYVFADREKFDPKQTTRQLRRSPLFRPSTFASGTTQYGDAIQRAEFWSDTQATGYHVLLGRPAVTPTIVVHVPASDGMTVTRQLGGRVGLVTESFFIDSVVPAVIKKLRLPPSKLIVFWSYDIELQPPSGQAGVILGEHSAGTNQARTRIWTFAWASWNTPDTVPVGDSDVAALSHELAEWYNDPFVGNAVPPWAAPPSYPCNTVLEVGDPLVGTTFVQDGDHLQDEAFLSWFSHEVPSTAIGGRYSFLGTLTAPPAVCTVP